ncbi:MAG: response regulator [Chitinispirillaceae bacterium]|nr:response regulator [Chitinispirillaceae bacterium]
MDYSKKEINKRILIIDDEVDVLNILKTFLEPLGYEVAVASSIGEALRHLEEKPFFLIITDIAMPDLDGYELINKFKEMNVKSSIAMMTGFGYNPKHTLIKIYKTCHYPCLFKPFNRAKVSETIINAWKEYHSDLLSPDAKPEDYGIKPYK